MGNGLLLFRRQFLQAIGAITLGSSFISVEQANGSGINKANFQPLEKNDHIDIGSEATEIIETAYRIGYDYEKKHKGCARCTVAALQDALGFIPADMSLFRAASCLDGGATPTKEANCGGFTGAGMVIGWMCGTDRFGDNKFSHDLIHMVHDHFVKDYGSVICKQVRKKNNSDCPDVVGKATKWTVEIILKQFTDYGLNGL